MAKEKDTTQSFEDAMQELEALVDSMENETLTLEDSLKSFEKGIQLTRLCHQALSKAEQEIKILTTDSDANNLVGSDAIEADYIRSDD